MMLVLQIWLSGTLFLSACAGGLVLAGAGSPDGKAWFAWNSAFAVFAFFFPVLYLLLCFCVAGGALFYDWIERLCEEIGPPTAVP